MQTEANGFMQRAWVQGTLSFMTSIGKAGLTLLTWTALLMLWMVQYLIVIPALWVAHLATFATKLGILGILLLFIPVIGWIILAFWIGTRVNAPHEKATYPTEPWLIELVRRDAKP